MRKKTQMSRFFKVAAVSAAALLAAIGGTGGSAFASPAQTTQAGCNKASSTEHAWQVKNPKASNAQVIAQLKPVATACNLVQMVLYSNGVAHGKLTNAQEQGVAALIEILDLAYPNSALAHSAGTQATGKSKSPAKTKPPAPSTTPAPTTPAPTTPPTTAAPKTYLTLQGSGDQTTAPFTIPDGWTLSYHYDCSSFDGSGNFVVNVNDPTGQPVFEDEGVNQLGAGQTSSSYQPKGGSLSLEILSECSWTVTATK